MDTLGRHLILDVWYKNFSEAIFFEKLHKVVHENFQVVQTANYQFEPHGVTRVYILSESHVAIHSYPEHQYVSVDIYICNESYDLTSVARSIINFFPCATHLERTIPRGRRSPADRPRSLELSR
jgi:S-adenosylmethionine decarboxylase